MNDMVEQFVNCVFGGMSELANQSQQVSAIF